MEGRTHEERSCIGKRRFLTRKEAKRARSRRWGPDEKVGHQQPYSCGYCGFFHLGHLPPLIARGEVDKDEWNWRGE